VENLGKNTLVEGGKRLVQDFCKEKGTACQKLKRASKIKPIWGKTWKREKLCTKLQHLKTKSPLHRQPCKKRGPNTGGKKVGEGGEKSSTNPKGKPEDRGMEMPNFLRKHRSEVMLGL